MTRLLNKLQQSRKMNYEPISMRGKIEGKIKTFYISMQWSYIYIHIYIYHWCISLVFGERTRTAIIANWGIRREERKKYERKQRFIEVARVEQYKAEANARPFLLRGNPYCPRLLCCTLCQLLTDPLTPPSHLMMTVQPHSQKKQNTFIFKLFDTHTHTHSLSIHLRVYMNALRN